MTPVEREAGVDLSGAPMGVRARSKEPTAGVVNNIFPVKQKCVNDFILSPCTNNILQISYSHHHTSMLEQWFTDHPWVLLSIMRSLFVCCLTKCIWHHCVIAQCVVLQHWKKKCFSFKPLFLHRLLLH